MLLTSWLDELLVKVQRERAERDVLRHQLHETLQRQGEQRLGVLPPHLLEEEPVQRERAERDVLRQDEQRVDVPPPDLLEEEPVRQPELLQWIRSDRTLYVLGALIYKVVVLLHKRWQQCSVRN